MRILIFGTMKQGGFEQAHIDKLRQYLQPEDQLLLKSGGGGILDFIWNTIDAIIAVNEPVPLQDVKMAPQLKLVLTFSENLTGNIKPYLDQKGIVCTVMPQTSLIGVAEHTIMLMLALTKQLIVSDAGVRQGDNPMNKEPVETDARKMAYNWLDLKQFDVLYGKNVGIIGFGTVGQRVAKIAHGFDMKIYYCCKTRKSKEIEDSYGATYVSMDELLKDADFITMNAALTEETYEIMDASAFAKMKETAFFINTARGKLVNEDDLCDALKNHQIAGAGLDVFEKEPLPVDSKLKKLNNVIFTAHSAGIPTFVSNSNAMEECGRILKLLK